jgi:hypothetical protein
VCSYNSAYDTNTHTHCTHPLHSISLPPRTTGNGGTITSANLGIMCLRSTNSNLYRAMKERYGGLRSLLSRFPHRYVRSAARH